MKKVLFTSNKKIITGIALLLFLSSNSFAAEPAFDKGSNVIGICIGFGVDYGHYAYNASSSLAPTFALTYDHGFFPEVGPGTIGIGGIFAVKGSSQNVAGEKYKNSSYIFGVRGTYHLTLLKDKNNKFDPYAGVTFGLRFNSDEYYDYYHDTYGTEYYSYANVNPVAGLFVGAHYNFVPNFGAFAEMGYDITFLRLGVNFNF